MISMPCKRKGQFTVQVGSDRVLSCCERPSWLARPPLCPRDRPGVKFADCAYGCLSGADAAVIITEWDEFRALDLARVKTALAKPVVVDLRNIYSPKTMKTWGITMSASAVVLAAKAERYSGTAGWRWTISVQLSYWMLASANQIVLVAVAPRQ
jgi:UDP-glucose/GDP-mannose dehydrogenase family, UDP binding domain